MMSLTMKFFFIKPEAIEEILGSGDPVVVEKLGKAIGELNLPNDVEMQVLATAKDFVQNGAKLPHLDLIGAFATMTLVRVLGEEFEFDTLQAVPGLQTVLRSMGTVIDYNLDAHLFGNPPPPFKAMDTAGTPFDIGHIDADDVAELSDFLESLDLHEDDLDDFSEEHGIELLEELIEPFCEALSEAMAAGCEVIVTTEG